MPSLALLTGARYTVYRSIVDIVRLHIRPRLGSNEADLRRKLNVALNLLAN
jgi:hypothetical protein